MRKKISILVLSLFLFSTVSSAIVPILFPIAAAGARIVVGQFAAAGLAQVVNPTTKKTLSIPSSNRALKVSFGIVSTAASIALFVKNSGYLPQSQAIGRCHVGSTVSITLEACVSRYAADYIVYPWLSLAGSTKPNGTGVWIQGIHSFYGLSSIGSWYPTGTSQTKPAVEVAWLDYSSSPSQIKTDKLVSDLKAFAVSNPSDFDAIVEMTGGASSLAPSDFAGVSGSVEVKADGQMYYKGVIQNGATWTDSAGLSHSSSVDSSGNLLVDGALPTGFTASNPTNPVNSTPDTAVPVGTGSATTNDLGSVVAALNDVKAQASSDASFIAGAVKDLSASNQAIQTDCDKHPNSAGCSDLGTSTGGASMTNDVIDLSASFSPVDVGQVASSVCPPPFSGSLQGQTYEFSYRPICDVMTGIKPIVLAIAWFISGMVFIGGVRQ